jgi:hypothetical protein
VVKALDYANRLASSVAEAKMTGAATRAAILSDREFTLPVGPFAEREDVVIPARRFPQPGRPRKSRFTGSYEKRGSQSHKCQICGMPGHNARNKSLHTSDQLARYRAGLPRERGEEEEGAEFDSSSSTS